MKLIIYTDGASRGNPGHASYGYTISDSRGKLMHEEGGYIGKATNNVAEYSAVLEAFKYIKNSFLKQSPFEIQLYADSLLVAQQLSGKYKIKSPHLKALIAEIKKMEADLGKISYTHVPRGKNTIADALANQALDTRL